MKAVINGNDIKTEVDFHKVIARVLNFPSYYGGNLDSLWDVLSTDLERPVTLVWENSVISREAMGDDFSRVNDVLLRVVTQDVTWGLDEKFELNLE